MGALGVTVAEGIEVARVAIRVGVIGCIFRREFEDMRIFKWQFRREADDDCISSTRLVGV